MAWAPGVSGNPKGRPPKGRALTTILESAGEIGHKPRGGRAPLARNKILAEMLWLALMEGQVKLTNGKSLQLTTNDWLDLAQFIYKQVDGPPRAELDLMSGDRPVAIQFVMADPNGTRPGSDPDADD